MSLLLRDLLLSGLVYVILTYLTFRLMRQKRHKRGNDDGGEPLELTPPHIDLPPGVRWPGTDPHLKKETEEEVLV